MSARQSWQDPVEEIRHSSYKVSVMVKGAKQYADNGLRFYTIREAEEYGAQLKRRWPLLSLYRIFPSEDQPNCVFPMPSDRYNVSRIQMLDGGNGKENGDA
jgi:hypothetical protein